jgi:hypothetical protein
MAFLGELSGAVAQAQRLPLFSLARNRRGYNGMKAGNGQTPSKLVERGVRFIKNHHPRGFVSQCARGVSKKGG